MPVQFIVTSYTESDRMAEVFGQLIFSGNYPAGGDSVTFAFDAGSAGVAGVNKNTASMNVFLQGQTGLHATRPPLRWNVQIEAAFGITLVPGVAAKDFKLKIWDPATKAELVAGAYPAAISGAVFNALDLQYKKNI